MFNFTRKMLIYFPKWWFQVTVQTPASRSSRSSLLGNAGFLIFARLANEKQYLVVLFLLSMLGFLS